MYNRHRHSDSLGRTVMIAVIAGIMFAGFLALTPRLTANSQSSEPVGPADVDAAVTDDAPAAEARYDGGGFDLDEPVVTDFDEDFGKEDEKDEPEDDECRVVEDWPEDEEDWPEEEDDWDDDDWSDESECDCDCDCGCKRDRPKDSDHKVHLDGSLDLQVELLGPGLGKESVSIRHGDLARFHFLVKNDGDEKLWGVYVYFEGHGHVACDTTYLAPGDTTECWANEQVFAGPDTIEVWATAWTTEIQVGVEVEYSYSISG